MGSFGGGGEGAGMSKLQQRKEAKRMMYLQSTEKGAVIAVKRR